MIQAVQWMWKGAKQGPNTGEETWLATMAEVRVGREETWRWGETSTQKGGTRREDKSRTDSEERPGLARKSVHSFMTSLAWALTHTKSKGNWRECKRNRKNWKM